MEQLMRPFKTLTLVAVIFVALSIENTSHGQMFAVGPWPNDSNSVPMNLYSVSPATGLASVVGNTGIDRLSGITTGLSGNLIGLAGHVLYSINPNNASTVQIGITPF